MGCGILEWLNAQLNKASSLEEGSGGRDDKGEGSGPVGGGGGKQSRKRQREQRRQMLALTSLLEGTSQGASGGERRQPPVPRPLYWAYPPSLAHFFTEQLLIKEEPNDEVLCLSLELAAKHFAWLNKGREGEAVVRSWEQHREQVRAILIKVLLNHPRAEEMILSLLCSGHVYP